MADKLIGQRHSILYKNYRTKYGELDIVSIKQGILYFVEVKTSKSHFVAPWQNMTRHKVLKYKRIIEIFLIRESRKISFFEYKPCIALVYLNPQNNEPVKIEFAENVIL